MIIFNQKYDKEIVEQELYSAFMYSEYGIDADMFDMLSGTVDKIYDLDNIRHLQDLEKVKKTIKGKLH